MRIPKTVPPQPPTSPMFVVTRRLPSYSGTQVSAALDERSHNAFLALSQQHPNGGTGVLREVVNRELTREPGVPRCRTYAARLGAVALSRGLSKSDVVREGIVRLYRDTFGHDPEGRIYKPRIQQFESVRRVYQDAHHRAREQGKTHEKARHEAEQATRKAARAMRRKEPFPIGAEQ